MATTSTGVYIDEDVGKDDFSTPGTEQLPFKTLLYAHIQRPPATSDGPQYFTRKSHSGPIPDGGDEIARLEYKPATKSALKKVANLYT